MTPEGNKSGFIVWSAMGDANASIPAPQPVWYQSMFGAFGRAPAAIGLTFVSQAALKAGVAERLGLRKTVMAVASYRTISKAQMIYNHADRGGPGNL
jgi:urease subunit alpha